MHQARSRVSWPFCCAGSELLRQRWTILPQAHQACGTKLPRTGLPGPSPLIHRPDLLVLFTTGYWRNAIVPGGILDPGTHLLPKPFSHASLAAKVRTLLDG